MNWKAITTIVVGVILIGLVAGVVRDWRMETFRPSVPNLGNRMSAS